MVIELNDTFYKDLKNRITDKRVHIRKGSASDLQKFMNELNVVQADFIVSSLPLAMIPDILRKRIIIEVNAQLNDQGEFIQFQYSLQSFKLFKKVFNKVSVRPCLFNMPPAFVYSCKKIRIYNYLRKKFRSCLMFKIYHCSLEKEYFLTK